MKATKKKTGRGGARKGAGRKKRAGWKQGTVSMPDAAWKGVKRLAARRKKSGEKNVSPGSVAGELVNSALVYFGLEEDKHAQLEAIAKERGISFDAVVGEVISMFLEERRQP